MRKIYESISETNKANGQKTQMNKGVIVIT